MPPRLIIEVVGDTSNLERSFSRTQRSAQRFSKDLERAGRGAASASLSFHGLGRSLGFASAQFLGGAGVVFAIKSTIQAAEESQKVLGQTQNAVKRSGESWAQYGKQIEAANLKLSQLSGFDDERLSTSFSLLVRRTKDVNEALRLNATVANVARGRNIELEAAANLVVKASLGQSGALRRLGIDVNKNATATELLARLNQKYAGSAAAYSNTAAGAQDRFRVALENFQEVLGAQALPAIAKYLNQTADWLNQTENQQRASDLLKGAVGAIRDTVATLTPIIKDAAAALKTFRDVIGGNREAIELLLATFAAFKVAKFVGAFDAIAASAGDKGAAGGIGLLTSRLKTLGAIGVITIGIDIAINGGKITEQIDSALKANGLGFLVGGDLNVSTVQQLNDLVAKGGLAGRVAAQALAKLPAASRTTVAPSSRFFFNGPPVVIGPQGTSGIGTAGQRPSGFAALSASARNQLALSQARTPAQELAALGQQRALLADQIGVISGRLRNAKGPKSAAAFAAQLADLNDQDKSALAQITSINQAAAADAKSTADAAKAAAKIREQAAFDIRRDSLQDLFRSRQGGIPGLAGLSLASLKKADVVRNKAAAAAEQAGQFRALGLTATGEARAPGVAALRASANALQKSIGGTFLDTPKTHSVLSGIRRVLSGHLGQVKEDMRRTVKGILDDLDSQLKNSNLIQGRFKHLSPNKLAEQLGFGGGRDATRRAAAVLSQIGFAGTVPGGRPAAFAGAGGGVHYHGPVTQNFNGIDDVGKFEAALTKRQAARPASRRGT